MTELTEDDLTILRDESCLVDGSAGFARLWDNPSAAKLAADTALRMNRATPGAPSVDLLLAAIGRREWLVSLYPETRAVPAPYEVSVLNGVGREIGGAEADGLIDALALAFVAAIRSLKQEDLTDG